ncbi:MAG: DoxX family protein [Bacteroidetes bacterium]|nr:DoxX family protein [Bacteroidota bacterium]
MTTKTKKTIGWTISSLLIAFFLFDSIGKLIRIDEVVKATTELGYPVVTIVPIGIVLLISTILYAIPRTSIFGAILLTAYLGGAVATHLRVGNPLFTHMLFPVYFGILVWVGQALRHENSLKLLTGKS